MRLSTTSKPVFHRSDRHLAGWWTEVTRYWSKEEDKTILDQYQLIGAKRVARIVNRSPHAVHKRAFQLGVANRTGWTTKEDILVRLAYGLVNAGLIAKNLSSRTVGAVHARAWRLGLAKERKLWDE